MEKVKTRWTKKKVWKINDLGCQLTEHIYLFLIQIKEKTPLRAREEKVEVSQVTVMR